MDLSRQRERVTLAERWVLAKFCEEALDYHIAHGLQRH